VDTLMRHVRDVHGREMGAEAQRQARCVFGRKPDEGEEWDVWVPEVERRERTWKVVPDGMWEWSRTP